MQTIPLQQFKLPFIKNFFYSDQYKLICKLAVAWKQNGKYKTPHFLPESESIIRDILARYKKKEHATFEGEYKFPNHQLSSEQIAAVNAAKSGNLAIVAKAGSGKTYTMEAIIRNCFQSESVLFLVFNKDLQLETTWKLANLPNCSVKTFDGFCLGIAKGINSRIAPGIYKTANILRKMRNKLAEDFGNSVDFYIGIIARLYDFCLASLSDFSEESVEEIWEEYKEGIVKKEIDQLDEVIQAVISLYEESFSPNYINEFSFGEISYLCATKWDLPRQNVLIVDEFQDVNAAQRKIVDKLKSNKLLISGDIDQSIYRFRGADSSIFYATISDYNCQEIELSESRRIPSVVAERIANQFGIGIRAKKNTGNCQDISLADFLANPSELFTCLVRRNTEAVAFGMACFSSGITVSVLNGQLTETLIAAAVKLSIKEENKTLDIQIIRENLENKEEKTEEDNCIESITNQVNDFNGLISVLLSFSEENNRQVTTAHKAKGCEWDNVVVFNPKGFDCGSPNEKDRSQDKNLEYVALSRVKNNLFVIGGEENGGEDKKITI